MQLSVVLGDIPLKNKVSFISQGHDDLWTSWPAAGGMQFENTVAEGLKVISYTHAYADGSTYEYVGSPTDKIQLWVSIPNATIDKH